MPKTIIATTLIALSLLPAHCCQNQTYFQYSECTFYHSPNDSSCTGFIWSHCTRHSDNTNYTSFHICTKNCCFSEEIYQQDWSGIQQCQQSLQKSWYLELFLMSILIFLPILCMLNIGVGVLIAKYCPTCRCLRGEENSQSNPTGQHIEHELKQEQELQQAEAGWTELANFYKIQEPCCFCSRKEISLELECRHVYHRSCFIAEFKKVQACALCRSKDLDKVKIFCQKCFSSSRDIVLLDNLEDLELNQQLCQKCS